jgi:hypothetical protein
MVLSSIGAVKVELIMVLPQIILNDTFAGAIKARGEISTNIEHSTLK